MIKIQVTFAYSLFFKHTHWAAEGESDDESYRTVIVRALELLENINNFRSM